MKYGAFIALMVIGTLLFPETDFSQINTSAEPLHPGIPKDKQTMALSRYLDETSWNSLFPHRYGYGWTDSPGRHQDFYSFRSLIIAAGRFPGFLSEGNEEIKKRELSAFLASIAYETNGGWSGAPGGYYTWGLYFKEENPKDGERYHYADSSKINYPPYPGMFYYGRGPIQLSWNYNYGEFSEAWFGNKDSLLENPDLLSRDPVVSFASAIWFWMTPQFPKPSCHDIMVENWKPNNLDSAKGRLPGFGAVVNVINGGVECGNLTEDEKTVYRYKYFQWYCDYFHVSPGNNVQCSSQKPFGQ